MATLVKSIVTEKDTESFLKQLKATNGPPIHTLKPAEARKVLEDLQAKHVVKHDVKIEEKTIPFGSGQVSLRVLRSKMATGKLFPIMYFHGGGWILGSANTHNRLVCDIAQKTNCAVVFVNYTPSPEARFPTAIEQAFAATKYISEQGNNLGLDASRLALAGDSVGGNMAIAVALLAKERKGPKIDCAALFYPVTNAEMSSSSYQQFAEGPWLTKPAMEWFWNTYEPDANARKKPLLSPLNASVDQLKEFPSTLVLTAEFDVLRDEGEAFAHKLMEAGTKVAAMRVQGAIHDFMLLNPLAETMATKCALSFATQFLTHKLGKSK